MGIIKPPHEAHPFIAVMFTNAQELTALQSIMCQKLGEYFEPGPIYKVLDFTDYYAEEFGSQLQKQFYVFNQPVSLEKFHEIKIWSNQIEQDFAQVVSDGWRRRVNLDPGYLEPSKLVLFSTKNYSHRIYIGAGIYAETTLIYERGNFKILPWTYPDYSWETNLRYLLEIRAAIVKLARSQKN